jgi:serine/threonine protein kinase
MYSHQIPEMEPYSYISTISGEENNKIFLIKSKLNKKFVLKTFKDNKDKENELQMLIKVTHSTILEVVDEIPAGLVLEFMETDAFEYFTLIHQSQPKLINLKVKEILLSTVLPGLEFIHSKQICHGDLKCGNILGKQTFPGCLVWKISDFDHAVEFDDLIDPGN